MNVPKPLHESAPIMEEFRVCRQCSLKVIFFDNHDPSTIYYDHSMWQSKTCILEMFLDFYGTYSPTEKMNYRDFLKDVFSFYEKNAIGNQNCYNIQHPSDLMSVSGSDAGNRRSSYQNSAAMAPPRSHTNIFDLAYSRTSRVDPPPVPRISGLCTQAQARTDVDIDFASATQDDSQGEEESALSSTPVLVNRKQHDLRSGPPVLTAWSNPIEIEDEEDALGIKMEPQEVPDSDAIKPRGGREMSPSPPSLVAEPLLNESIRSGASRGQRMKTGPPPHSKHQKYQGKRALCNICNKTLADKRGLWKHKKNVHRVNSQPHPCTICKRNFQTAAALFNHYRKHKREGHEETVDSILGNAKEVGWKEKKVGIMAAKLPAVSSKVHAKTKRKRTRLTMGRKGKRRERDYKEELPPPKKPKAERRPSSSPRKRCGVCRTTFRNREVYLEHARAVHPDREIFMCDFCDKMFLSLNHFRAHQKTHPSYFNAGRDDRDVERLAMKEHESEHRAIEEPPEEPEMEDMMSRDVEDDEDIMITDQMDRDPKPMMGLGLENENEEYFLGT